MRFAGQQILVAVERLQYGPPQALAKPGDADPNDGERRPVDQIRLDVGRAGEKPAHQGDAQDRRDKTRSEPAEAARQQNGWHEQQEG